MKIRILPVVPDGPALKAGDEFEGDTSLEIVRSLRGISPFNDGLSDDEYIDKIAESVHRLMDVDVTFLGSTANVRAAELLESLYLGGLIEYVDDVGGAISS